MSRIFRRPMFRKGGNVGEGIMTGIVDREMHAVSDPNGVGAQNAPVDFEQQYIDKITAAGAGSQGMDPLTAYLLAAGPAISSGTSFSDAVGKLADPNKQLIELMNKRASDERNLKVGAAQFGLEKGFEKSQTESDRAFKERMLDKELDFKKQDLDNIDRDIENISKDQVSKGEYSNLQEARRVNTWKFKTIDSPELSGKKIGGLLKESDLKNESNFAKKLLNKNKEGYVFYDRFNDRILEVGRIDGEPALIEIQMGGASPVVTKVPIVPTVPVKEKTNYELLTGKEPVATSYEDMIKETEENTQKIKDVLTTPVDMSKIDTTNIRKR